jgi:hypothetical protein
MERTWKGCHKNRAARGQRMLTINAPFESMTSPGSWAEAVSRSARAFWPIVATIADILRCKALVIRPLKNRSQMRTVFARHLL